MTEYPYQPPQRELTDTLLAFRDMQLASTFRVQVQADPLGGPNSILTLMRGNHRVKSALHPVPPGARVQLRQAWRDDPAESYEGPLGPGFRFARWPAWIVEVDGQRVIEVVERDTYPPRPPAPKVPVWTHMRRVLREQARADADWIARKLGYHRDDECGGDW